MKVLPTLGFALTLASISHASYDLMYVVDGASKSIHRVDPINNVALGRFGVGQLNNPLSVALDSQNNVYVLDTNGALDARIRKFNGSTGEYMGGFALNIGASTGARLRITGNKMYVTAGNYSMVPFLFGYNLNGVPLGPSGFIRGTSNALHSQGLAFFNNEVIWSAYNPFSPLHRLYRASLSAPLNGSVYSDFDFALGLAQPMHQFAASSTSLISVNGADSISVWNSAFTNVGGTSVTGFTSVNGVAAGHDDLFHLAGMSSGTFAVGKYYANSNDFISPVNIFGTGITDPRDVAVVVAPEPGSMMALAGGLAVLMAKRRRRIISQKRA